MEYKTEFADELPDHLLRNSGFSNRNAATGAAGNQEQKEGEEAIADVEARIMQFAIQNQASAGHGKQEQKASAFLARVQRQLDSVLVGHEEIQRDVNHNHNQQFAKVPDVDFWATEYSVAWAKLKKKELEERKKTCSGGRRRRRRRCGYGPSAATA